MSDPWNRMTWAIVLGCPNEVVFTSTSLLLWETNLEIRNRLSQQKNKKKKQPSGFWPSSALRKIQFLHQNIKNATEFYEYEIYDMIMGKWSPSLSLTLCGSMADPSFRFILFLFSFYLGYVWYLILHHSLN